MELKLTCPKCGAPDLRVVPKIVSPYISIAHAECSACGWHTNDGPFRFDQKQPRTIADKLRSMTDEEIAGALEATSADSNCDVCEGKHGKCDAAGPHGSERCKERILAYLRTPLTEEKEEKPMQEMTLNEYQRLAQRTSNEEHDDFRTLALKKIDNGILGLCGETGECSDHWKKHKHQGHKLDADKLADECGDVLWYVAELAAGLGLTLEAIARHNIEKLEKRYPKGHFEAERSINREE